MSRRQVAAGCQLGMWCCDAENMPRELLEKAHLPPQAWARKHPKHERKIKDDPLILLLCRNCHGWIDAEMRKRGLNEESPEEDVWKFVNEIWQRKRY